MELATTYKYDVVIVGAGPAGMCAGMYAGRSMLKSVVLERGFPGGELLNTELIEDYPGFETILGHELAQKFADHAAKFGAEFKNGVTVDCVEKRADGTFETRTDSGDVYQSPAVIVTAGGTPVKLGIPGEIEYAGKGVSYCAICDGAFFRNQTIAVVGGGDAATEEADFLTRYADKVYLDSPARRTSLVEDPAAAPVRESEGRGHLERRRRSRRGRRAGVGQDAAAA